VTHQNLWQLILRYRLQGSFAALIPVDAQSVWAYGQTSRHLLWQLRGHHWRVR